MASHNIKQQLLQLCADIQNSRIANAQKAMEDAQQAANSEEKSTAGDKYDTSRAMSHNLRDMNARQLQEALKELAVLEQINTDSIHDSIRLGSVVKTSQANYFIAISAGPVKIGQETYFAISITSPIGQLLMHKQKGDSFTFRENIIKISEVF